MGSRRAIPKGHLGFEDGLIEVSVESSANSRASSRIHERLLTSGEFDSDLLFDSLPSNSCSNEDVTLSVDNAHHSFQKEKASAASAPDMREVYEELQAINDKLKDELQVLHERTNHVNKREEAVKALELQIDSRITELQETYKNEIMQLEDVIKQKNKEIKRLSQNFETLKMSNSSMKSQMDTLQVHHRSLEKQHGCLQGRLANLLKKRPGTSEIPQALISTADPQPQFKVSSAPKPSKAQAKQKPQKPSRCVIDLLLGLLDWVSDANLRQAVVEKAGAHQSHILSKDYCVQMIPQLVELLQEIHQSNPSSSSPSPSPLPMLRFLYWSIRHIDAEDKQRRQTLSSTLRRLGEHLYGAHILRIGSTSHAEQDLTRSKDKPSNDPHVKLVACLLVLMTVTQVDKCARVLDELRECVQSTQGKELFVFYQASSLLLPYLRPANKALSSAALDVYVHMCMESDYLDDFLVSCSNPSWFQAVSLVWTLPTVPQSLLEKLSILLQKLSKHRTNKRHFEVCGLVNSCQEMTRTLSDSSPFLLLNIKSILFNLGISK